MEQQAEQVLRVIKVEKFENCILPWHVHVFVKGLEYGNIGDFKGDDIRMMELQDKRDDSSQSSVGLLVGGQWMEFVGDIIIYPDGELSLDEVEDYPFARILRYKSKKGE